MADPNPFYTYKPIDLATDAIRVLRLCRGYDTDPIACELVEIFLQDDGVPYEALSYTWGDSTVDVEVFISGRKKLVRDNLYTALHCLRRANEDRWPWVDALCIDQDDPREKTHQVERMRRIYEKADRVLIWLGRTTEDVDLLMEMMTLLGKRSRRRKSYRKEEPNAWLEEWPILMNEVGGMRTDFNSRRRSGLVDLLGRPWFQRVWILQEAFNAKRAAILCGWNEVPTETFVIMPRLMDVEVDGLVQAVLDIMPGYLRRSSWGNEKPDLRALLRRFNNSKATDLRDKVYALLGIASDARADGKLQPNYSISLGDTIRHAICYLLFSSGPDWICPLPGWAFDLFILNLSDLPSQVLQWAVAHGKETTVRELLARTAVDINRAPAAGQSPLAYLARHGYPQESHPSHTIVKTLLARDEINVNILDSAGDTPLHIAAEHNTPLVARELLSHHDIHPNHRNQKWKTPLGLAAENGHDTIIRLLLQHPQTDIEHPNGPPDIKQYTPLWLAASKGNTSTVELLLQHGADIEARDTLAGETALYFACRRGDLSVAELLLAHGADKDARDSTTNTTPLWIASKQGHTPIFSLLLSRGAALDDGALTKSRQSVLWAAASAGHEDIVQIILANLPPPTSPLSPPPSTTTTFLELKDTHERAPALWIASKNNHPRIVLALLAAGADITCRDCFHHTPLWAAIYHRRLGVARVLIEAGARLQPGDGVEDWSPEQGGLVLRRKRVLEVFEGMGMGREEVEKEIGRGNSIRWRVGEEWRGEGGDVAGDGDLAMDE